MTVSGESSGVRIEEAAADGRHRLHLRGELDLASVASVRARVRTVCATPGVRAVVLDLEGIRFIDSTGLRTLLEARELCVERGCAFLLEHVPPRVQRVFEIAGVGELSVPRAAVRADGGRL